MTDRPRLVALAGPFEGRSFALGAEPFTIGRQSASSLALGHATVSRRHCVIEPAAGDGARLRDLGSRTGTFVNGLPVSERRLAHGDFVKVGESLFVFLSAEQEDVPVTLPVRFEDGASAASTLELAAGAEPSRELTARHLTTLLRISNAIHEERRPESMARRLAALVAEAVPAERVAVVLFDAGEPVPLHVEDRSGGEEELTLSLTLLRRVRAEGVAVLVRDVAADTALDGAASLDGSGVRSLLCAPLGLAEDSLGVLYADNRAPARPFDRSHLELCAAAATMAAAAFANVQRVAALEAENRRLRAADLDHEMIGESAAMARLLELVAKVAPTDLTVLAVGESGTGKELVARALHRNSPRAEGPFVAINCATLSETLLESELFGHERGAFTGALATKPGKLELADGGTVFLDEVGEIPPTLQAKLLRALETRRFERVGGTRTLSVDLRVVAATNRDLEAAIADGSFRRDLYHRLAVFTLDLPPLRRRRDDVPLLAAHFAARTAERLKRPFAGVTAAARACLSSYEWPGNVRELANAMERAVVLAEGGLVRPEDLPEALVESTAVQDLPEEGYHAAVNAAKRRILLDAVRLADGNLKEAARVLRLNRTYFHRLLNHLGLRREL
jgi:Nif-specific regulatory protein